MKIHEWDDFELPDCGDDGLEPSYNGEGGRNKRLVLTKEEKIQVAKLAMIGCSVKEICFILGKPKARDTMHKWYQPLLDLGTSEGNARLRKTQFKKAVEDEDVKMLIWLGRQRLGQQEQVVDVEQPLPWTDSDGEVSE